MWFKKTSPPHHYASLPTLLGVLGILLGLFGFLRIGAQWAVAKESYPAAGIFPVLIALAPYQPPYQQREQDCTYNQIYYSMDGQTRQPSELEKRSEAESRQRCLDSISATRDQAIITDLNQAAFFMFVGLGLLAVRPWFFRIDA